MSKERPKEPSGWFTARRYSDARNALDAYESARNRLLIQDELDASVLRFTLNGVSYVAVPYSLLRTIAQEFGALHSSVLPSNLQPPTAALID